MIFPTKRELLAYYGARNLGVLERQFNADGRLTPVMLDTEGPRLLIATILGRGDSRLRVLTFPLHASDLLGAIELERRAAEQAAIH